MLSTFRNIANKLLTNKICFINYIYDDIFELNTNVLCFPNKGTEIYQLQSTYDGKK